FGMPLYFGAPGSASVTGTTGALTPQNTQGVNFSTTGQRRTPAYVTAIGFDRPNPPVAAPSRLQADLQDVLARSSRLSNGNGLRVTVENGTVVLRGSVPPLRERRLAEGMMRLTPGVADVRNELLVNGKPPPEEP